MRRRNLLSFSSVAELLALAACSDQSQPFASDIPADLARGVPGVGGFFYDAQDLDSFAVR